MLAPKTGDLPCARGRAGVDGCGHSQRCGTTAAAGARRLIGRSLDDHVFCSAPAEAASDCAIRTFARRGMIGRRRAVRGNAAEHRRFGHPAVAAEPAVRAVEPVERQRLRGGPTASLAAPLTKPFRQATALTARQRKRRQRNRARAPHGRLRAAGHCVRAAACSQT